MKYLDLDISRYWLYLDESYFQARACKPSEYQTELYSKCFRRFVPIPNALLCLASTVCVAMDEQNGQVL